jgi:arylsulfatase A-like enzyme
VTEPGRVSGKVPGTVAIFGGPGNRGQSTIPGDTASVVDLAPTVLHLLGVPLSRELAGSPLSTHVAVARVPAPVPSYGRPVRDAAPRSGKPLDQEMIDRLRSLGYVR